MVTLQPFDTEEDARLLRTTRRTDLPPRFGPTTSNGLTAWPQALNLVRWVNTCCSGLAHALWGRQGVGLGREGGFEASSSSQNPKTSASNFLGQKRRREDQFPPSESNWVCKARAGC